MINVVTDHGSSFKGLMAYLMHDIGTTESAERVAFTHTHNLATEDPEQAWKVMVSTAKSQDALKAQAGVKNTGRRSHKSVMHYVLSWSPEEHGEYTREDMINAATASMTYLGVDKGERIGKKVTAKRTQRGHEHQAIFVCHDEGPGKNPHVHVVLNRVHPEHGVMLSDSKDYDKLSAWALDYRKAQGKEDLCPERVKNAAKRAQGVLTSHPRKPRNIYEQEQAIEGAKNDPDRRAWLEEQARKTKAMRAKEARTRARYAERQRALEHNHLAAAKSERDRTAKAVRAKRAEIRAAHAPKIDALTDKQRSERAAFFEAYHTAAGRARNAWEALKTREWLRGIRSRPVDAIKHGFKLAFDAGLQLRDIERFHKREAGELRGQRQAEERDVARDLRTQQKARMDKLRLDYQRDRLSLNFERQMDRAKLRAEWRQLLKDRRKITDTRGVDPKAQYLERLRERNRQVQERRGQSRDRGGRDRE